MFSLKEIKSKRYVYVVYGAVEEYNIDFKNAIMSSITPLYVVNWIKSVILDFLYNIKK